ncbi:unnamed protein product, partial [Iphiclides podalirius]
MIKLLTVLVAVIANRQYCRHVMPTGAIVTTLQLFAAADRTERAFFPAHQSAAAGVWFLRPHASRRTDSTFYATSEHYVKSNALTCCSDATSSLLLSSETTDKRIE